MDKHTGYNAQRTGMETRGHTHTHTHIRDGDREALCFRLSIDDIFVIDNRGPLLPPFVSIMVFSLSNGGRFFDRGVARANFVIHWFRCSDGAGVDCWGNCCDTQGRVSREFGYLESLVSRIFGSKYGSTWKGIRKLVDHLRFNRKSFELFKFYGNL